MKEDSVIWMKIDHPKKFIKTILGLLSVTYNAGYWDGYKNAKTY